MKQKITAPKGPKAAADSCDQATRRKINGELLFRSTKGGRFARKVFHRMFRAVGRAFTPEFVTSPEWYLKSSWTIEQENEFRNWMIHEGIKTMRWRKRQASKEASMFLLFYGWTKKS